MLNVRLNLSKLVTIATCFAVTTMFSGCDDKEKQSDIKVENQAALTQTAYADQTGGTSGVTIVTSGAWSSTITEGSVKSTKSGAATWLSINPSSGSSAGEYTIIISLEPNFTGSERTATITVKCGDTEIIIFVTQKAIKENGEPNDEPNKPKSGDVFVAGFESGQGPTTATVWKNGVAQRLSYGTRNARAHSVFVSGGNVYVAGYEGNLGEVAVPKLWVNGVEQNLTGIGSAYSVFVSNGDVFVAGSNLWKNGEAQNHTNIGEGVDAFANSIFVSGNNVYMVGRVTVTHLEIQYTSAVLWINDEMQILDRIDTSNSVFVSNGDVYVAGTAADHSTSNIRNRARLLKNGEVQDISDGTQNESANSVFVHNGDVYVAGSKLWKNGIVQKLADGTDHPFGNSVFVSGDNVYVAGDNKLLKNGIEQHLESEAFLQAYSVFVVE